MAAIAETSRRSSFSLCARYPVRTPVTSRYVQRISSRSGSSAGGFGGERNRAERGDRKEGAADRDRHLGVPAIVHRRRAPEAERVELARHERPQKSPPPLGSPVTRLAAG